MRTTLPNELASLFSVAVSTVFAAFLFGCDSRLGGVDGTSGSPAERWPVTLSTSVSKVEFDRTETVEVTFKLINISNKPVAVCASGAGNIHVERFEVNGGSVERVSAPLSHVELVTDEWLPAFKMLAPGESTVFFDNLMSGPEEWAVGIEAHDAVIVVEDDLPVVEGSKYYVYRNPGLGEYSITYSYSYEGPVPEAMRSAAFAGKVVAVPLRFRVH